MHNNHLFKPVDILLVEDNPGDADLAREALEGSKMKNNLYVVEDGIEAMAFLKKTTGYENSPHPDLILLDLKPAPYGRPGGSGGNQS